MKNNMFYKVIIVLIVLFSLSSCGKEQVEGKHVHKWSAWQTEKAASCKEEGLLERHCTGCDEKDEIILNTIAHTFNDGEILVEASCSSEGLMSFKCTTCEKVVEQKIPTLEHKVVVDNAVHATCYEDGLSEGSHCEKCGTTIVEQKVVPSTGHIWGRPVVISKPTCNIEGTQKVTCTICKAVKEQTIDKLEHSIVNSNYTEPSCTSAGLIGVGHCSWCDKDIYQSKPVSPLGHNFVSGVCIRCKEKQKDGGMTFKKINGEYYLADVGIIANPSVVIPVMYENSYVVGILEGAFRNAQYANTICIPKNVKVIEEGAFEGCSHLQGFILDVSNPYIALENNCLIDKETKVLLEGAANAIIPEGVVEIRSGAFKNRVGVTIINLPNSLEVIADDAFEGCGNILIIEVALDNSKYYSKNNCLLLKENDTLLLGGRNSIIPDGTVTIGSNAFAGCEMMYEINIPDSVTTIMPGAFTGCIMVSELKISKNLTEIEGAFEGFAGLTKVIIDKENPKYELVDGCIVEKATKKLILSNPDGVIPKDIEIIGKGAFAGNYHLTTITLPDTIKSIEDRAFADCDNLQKIVLSSSVTSIGDEAFAGCINLKEIIIPDSVTSLGERAFAGCKTLQRIELSKHITYVGKEAFNNCDILVIACEAKKQPAEWDKDWNPDERPTFWDIYIVN